MKLKRLFSFMTALIMIFSICTMLPVRISVPLNTYALTEANQEFINNLGRSAQKNYNRYKILPSMTVAQAILESNWGKSSLSKLYYNFFGMKAGSNYNGETVTLKTGEEINGTQITVNGTFRVYHSFDEGIEGYYQFITGYSRYSNLIGETDYKTACNKIRQDGWATDSAYSTKLINLIEAYNLTRFDYFDSPVQMVTPSISTDKSSYTVGDTVNISWIASPSGSNLEHYWLKIDAPNGTVIINETMNRNTSYSFVVSQSGNYTVTAFATPYNSANGEGSLTDTKTISVKPKNISYDMSLSETYIELEPDQSKDITLTIRGDFNDGNIGQLNSDTSNCNNIADISYVNGGKASSYIEMKYKVTALSSGSGSCRFYVTLDGKTIGSVNLNIVVKVNKCKVTLIDNFRLNTIDEYEAVCGTVFNSSQLPSMRKDGYIFEGWYDGNTKYSIGSTVPEVSELRLYAKWTANDNYSDVNSERYGDINGDGKISAIDTGNLSMYINGTYEFTDLEKIYADLDGSGVIDEYDLRVLQLLYTYAPGNEPIEVLAAKEGWEEKYLYTCHPLLSLKINGQSSYDAKPGETVKLTLEVEGADLKYSTVGLHFSYDEELNLSKLKEGTAVRLLAPIYEIHPSYCFLTLSGVKNNGSDGVMMETEFKIPENAETGKTYRFEFYQDTYDLFTNLLNDSVGKAMQKSAFENWQNCSIRVIGGKGDINSDGKVTISDAVILKKWLLAVPNTKIENWKSADLYEDGKVDIFDMVEMRKLLIKNK
ncbi:MAG: glucosaminidase domain-containing protein [Ruminococcus flavefaciens]|nr:glucosaminidase domain-containing protein [Ruminococcus flavefaciens]